MRPFPILAIALFAAWIPNASRYPGYIVFHNTDTLHGKVRFYPGFASSYSPYEAVDFLDSSGHDSTYYPEEVTAFGFTDKSGDHIFRSKMHRDSSLKFQQVIVAGPQASVYVYEPSGAHPANELFFTFERRDGMFLFLKNFDRLETFRTRLREFYGDAHGLGAFIDDKFTSRWKIEADIRLVVMEANKNAD